MSDFAQFSKTNLYPWGISEFSNFDLVWKRRIRSSLSDRFLFRIERLIPRRLRRAIVLHANYIIHRDAVRLGATRFTEWGNIQSTAWFVRQIDPEYDANFDLFDSEGNPTTLWWAGLRGLQDGQK